MKTTQAAIITAMSVGSPRASERLKTTSAATPMSAMNGVSWWLGTIAAKMRISVAMSAARWPPKRARADGVPAGRGPGTSGRRSPTITRNRNSDSACGEK